ncbi:hypothetical protein [Pseudomonas sp. FP1740]|uniref:hypothetical protein n=1 Tax=Pseudomonas sp. FP1740 TaxID=2954078 RepID=UPI00273599AB|nr:hypothetical protein [Pseudomonas sp. FP1740]WLG43255.1 hypothetical protein PSH69_20650 [Pseudomonas sp. FP1740]
MNWKPISKHCMSSDEGYLLRKYKLEFGAAYVARTPAGKILHSGKDLDKAKAACVEHLNSKKVAA